MDGEFTTYIILALVFGAVVLTVLTGLDYVVSAVRGNQNLRR